MPGGETANHLVMSHGCKTHGGDAAALGTIGVSTKLAWGDDCFEISGDGVGCACKDTVGWGPGWIKEFPKCGLVHVEDRIEGAETKEFCDGSGADRGGEDFGANRTLLRGEDAHPDFFRFRAISPKLKKPLEIAGLVCNLAGDGAMDRNARLRKVLQYTLISCRRATYIVFRLETVDGDDDVETRESCPVSGNGAEGTGDDLDVDATFVEFGKDRFELAIADEGISADEGDMERLVLVNYAEDIFYESVFFIVGELAEGDGTVASEVGRIEGITSGAAERAFPSEFDGQRRTPTQENGFPCLHYF
jgi:hypothetical protein